MELLADDGTPAGEAEKIAAHEAGLLHRGFSVFLFDESGRLLLQRRSEAKYHFRRRWSNTCCGHPPPGADIRTAAADRLRAELGIAMDLEMAGSFRYRAVDDETSLIEWEDDTVLAGYVRHDANIEPDPAEASAVRFLPLSELRAEMASSPLSFTPWLRSGLECAQAAGHPKREG